MIICIKNLKLNAILGILDDERKKPQDIIIDCSIKYDYLDNRFINYALVVDLIKLTIIQGHFKLIETALIVLIKKIRSTFPLCNFISLQITKPSIIKDCEVSVSYEKRFK